MTIHYALVARRETILAECAMSTGTANVVARKILSRIEDGNHKMSYRQEEYTFNYKVQDSICYLCMSDDNSPRYASFAFLDEIQQRFSKMYGPRAMTAGPMEMDREFGPFLKEKMNSFSTRNGAPINRVQSQVEEVKSIMMKNIDQVIARGERMEILVDKTQNLNDTASQFQKTARQVRRKMWLKNIKLTALIALFVLLVVFFLIVVPACGGFSFKNCK
eukprot:TRINITY_DN10586_c0_g2_i1.p1 TRINITY_DN10586_c0_g2~~TRINITY_DN10586_c0_g2_i1.p1  ORF type:complete len:219 (+),score=60.06 TRINITY_DN10586_c0_g2_i1:69-725(+)